MTGDNWQPIETAPKDGSVFVVGYKKRNGYRLRPRVVVRGGSYGNFFETWGNHEVEPPDYWMPLPPEPPEP